MAENKQYLESLENGLAKMNQMYALFNKQMAEKGLLQASVKFLPSAMKAERYSSFFHLHFFFRNLIVFHILVILHRCILIASFGYHSNANTNLEELKKYVLKKDKEVAEIHAKELQEELEEAGQATGALQPASS